MKWKVSRPHTRRLAACLLGALVLQLPLAWAIVYFNSPSWQGETSVILIKPEGNTSNVDRVRIENDTHFGVRWVTITGWSVAYQANVCRSDEEQWFANEPMWPFPDSELFPGRLDASKWPASVPAVGAYPTGHYGQSLVEAYAIGWPFLSATGRADRDCATNNWTTRGAVLVPEPKFRKWTLLGTVPLCYTPRWQGIAANTFVLGLPLWAAWTTLAWARLRRMRRRGLCGQCGYDLRGLPTGATCPECGPSESR